MSAVKVRTVTLSTVSEARIESSSDPIHLPASDLRVSFCNVDSDDSRREGLVRVIDLNARSDRSVLEDHVIGLRVRRSADEFFNFRHF